MHNSVAVYFKQDINYTVFIQLNTTPLCTGALGLRGHNVSRHVLDLDHVRDRVPKVRNIISVRMVNLKLNDVMTVPVGNKQNVCV
jgi:hypothetical protein